MRLHQHINFSCYVLFLSLWSLPVAASIEPSLFIRAASNSVYNGVSENANQPIIAINAEFQLNYHWTAGIQLEKSEAGKSQRNQNLSSYIGYDKKISENWLSSTYFTHRAFLDSQREWNYDEFSSRLSHKNGFSVALSYAPNYYSSSAKAIGTTVNYSRPLIKNSYIKASVGNMSIPSLLSYQFIETTVGINYKRLNVELGYHWVNERILSTPVGNITSPQFVFSVNYFAF